MELIDSEDWSTEIWENDEETETWTFRIRFVIVGFYKNVQPISCLLLYEKSYS